MRNKAVIKYSNNKNLTFAATAFSLLSLLLVMGCANTNSAETDGRISILNDSISFAPPKGFSSAKKEELKWNMPDNSDPAYIFASEERSAAVSIYLDDLNLGPDQLVEIKAFVERLHKDYSGWITSEIIEIDGRQWFHFEWEEPAADALEKLVPPIADDSMAPPIKQKPRYFRQFTTILNGKNLRFLYESNLEDRAKFKHDFESSFQTIEFK